MCVRGRFQLCGEGKVFSNHKTGPDKEKLNKTEMNNKISLDIITMVNEIKRINKSSKPAKKIRRLHETTERSVV